MIVIIFNLTSGLNCLLQIKQITQLFQDDQNVSTKGTLEYYDDDQLGVLTGLGIDLQESLNNEKPRMELDFEIISN